MSYKKQDLQTIGWIVGIVAAFVVGTQISEITKSDGVAFKDDGSGLLELKLYNCEQRNKELTEQL